MRLEGGVAGLIIGLGQEEIMAGGYTTTIQDNTEAETLAGFRIPETPVEEIIQIRIMGRVGGVDN